MKLSAQVSPGTQRKLEDSIMATTVRRVQHQYHQCPGWLQRVLRDSALCLLLVFPYMFS